MLGSIISLRLIAELSSALQIMARPKIILVYDG